MMRWFSLVVVAGLASLSMSAAAFAQSSDDTPRAYVDHLPCGGMDCSYTAEQQERLRSSEELQTLMTRFAGDITQGSSTEGWEDVDDHIDGNIAILERNLANLRGLTATANQIDRMWAELNPETSGPAAAERLQGIIDTTTQMLTNAREIRTRLRKTGKQA